LVSGTRWDLQANVTTLHTTRQSLDHLAVATRENLKALESTEQRVTLTVQQGRRPNLDLLKIPTARDRRDAASTDPARISIEMERGSDSEHKRTHKQRIHAVSTGRASAAMRL